MFENKYQKNNKNSKKNPPNPGIEPGPPGWKPGILTTRPIGTSYALILEEKK